MSLMIWRFGGTILFTRRIDITYWGMARSVLGGGEGARD
jgi:hypothetical protein